MADKKISALTAVASLSNTDVFPVVQGAVTKKAAISDIKNYLPQASSTVTGLLTNTDWSTFNNKQSALTLGNITESTSSVLTITGATGAIIGSGVTLQVKQASGSQSGYLSSTDWTTFNSKQNSLTLTTTGTGAATLVGSTLNIPTGITSALTSLNGQSGSSQTFATATTGTDFSIASVGDVHTFAIPSASASNRGLLTSTDWSTFNSKEPALTKGNLTETTSSVLTITGGTGAIIGSGLTIAVTRSTALADGYLKASDFSTFAAKQDAITLTTTGTTGAASFVGNVLNIPNYSSGVITAITSLNGDTSASQTFATGSSGSDFNISTAGSIHTFNIPDSDGNNTRGLLIKQDWQNFNTAYTNRITSLTTTGTSGAATLSGNTLNIPQYGGITEDKVNPITASISSLGSAMVAETILATLPMINTGTNLVSGRLFFIPVFIHKSMTITGVKFFQSTQGNYTAGSYNGVGLFTISSGTLTRVASSTDDGNIWKGTANTIQSKAFSSTYSASTGLHFVGILWISSATTTAPAIHGGTILTNYNSVTNDFTNSSKLLSYIGSQTSIGSSYAMSGNTSTTGNYYVALY